MASDPWGTLLLFVFGGGLLVVTATMVGVLLNLTRPTQASIAWSAFVCSLCTAFCFTRMAHWLGPQVTAVVAVAAAINAGAAYLGWRVRSR